MFNFFSFYYFNCLFIQVPTSAVFSPPLFLFLSLPPRCVWSIGVCEHTGFLLEEPSSRYFDALQNFSLNYIKYRLADLAIYKLVDLGLKTLGVYVWGDGG